MLYTFVKERGFTKIALRHHLDGACSELERRRKQAKALISRLREGIPAVKSSMLSALRNAEPTHLLDLKLGARDAVGEDEAASRLG